MEGTRALGRGEEAVYAAKVGALAIDSEPDVVAWKGSGNPAQVFWISPRGTAPIAALVTFRRKNEAPFRGDLTEPAGHFLLSRT